MAQRPALAIPEKNPAAAVATGAERPASARSGAGRQGKRGVAFWLMPEAFKQLRGMTTGEDRSMQSLMEEATDLLFESRGMHRLAQSSGRST